MTTQNATALVLGSWSVVLFLAIIGQEIPIGTWIFATFALGVLIGNITKAKV